MFPENFLSFQAFFLFRKIFSLSDASDKFSFFRAFFLFQKTFLFGFFRNPLSLFGFFRPPPLSLSELSSFSEKFFSLSLSLDLISLSFPLGIEAGHSLWRDEQVKRGGRVIGYRTATVTFFPPEVEWGQITPAYRHRLPPGRNPGLR